MFLLLSL
jgi:hypothetical protein